MSASPTQLYFAFGSNLWLHQMAKRCPDSAYVGRAVLPDFRWQINNRGFANVIPCSGYTVHGLVYRVDATDEARLDRNEGVHSGAYSRSYQSILLYEAPRGLQQPTRFLLEDARAAAAAVGAVRWGSHSGEPGPTCRIVGHVLVYLSSSHVQEGTARDEYIDRMNHGIKDAVALGVPADYFENAIRPFIPNRPVLRRTDHRARARQREDSEPDHHYQYHHHSGRRRATSTPAEPRWTPRRRGPSPERGDWLASQHFAQRFGLGRSTSSHRASRPYSTSTYWR